MIISIKGKDLKERHWIPDKILREILTELLKDFIGIEVTELTVERGPEEEPESKDEEWK